MIDLVAFQQLKKLLLESKRGGGKFILFLSLFLSLHKHFQYKYFFLNCQFIFLYWFTHLLSSEISLFFWNISYMKNRINWVLLLTVLLLCLISVQKRVIKRGLSSIFTTKATSKMSQNIFCLKNKLNQVLL